MSIGLHLLVLFYRAVLIQKKDRSSHKTMVPSHPDSSLHGTSTSSVPVLGLVLVPVVLSRGVTPRTKNLKFYTGVDM
jgi:hypothetical protein